jgi:hypothetical protein
MAQIYLINVGANTSHGGKARGPIFPDGTWVYMPFPREKSNAKGQPFPDLTRRFVSVGRDIKCHLDPDWQRFTYGDCCKEPRAVSLSKAKIGDILLFWGLLWRTDHDVSIFKSRAKGWYLFGALRIEYILEEGQKIDTLPSDIRQRAGRNAHVCDGRVEKGHRERVFVGSRRPSRRFERAVDLEVNRDGGLMHRIVRTADGRKIRWNESPNWKSVTRACRAILDLDKPGDRTVATDLARCIRKENEGFDLIAYA